MREIYLIPDAQLKETLLHAEIALLNGPKIKFTNSTSWRKQTMPNYPGVYALFENTDTILYIGESGDLRKRMSDLCRTINHTFRRKLAYNRYTALKISTKTKFDVNTERLLDDFFEEKLHVTFIKANFGRAEIEQYLVTKHQPVLLNSESKRKLQLE